MGRGFQIVAVNYHYSSGLPFDRSVSSFTCWWFSKMWPFWSTAEKGNLFSGCPYFLWEWETPAAEMSQALTLRWVTRNHRTVNKLPYPGLAMVVKRFVSLWAALSYGYRVPPVLTKTHAQEYFSVCQAQGDVRPRTFGYRVPTGIPNIVGVASFCLFPPKVLWDLLEPSVIQNIL